MMGNCYNWKVKRIPAETMRRLAEAGEELKRSNTVYENKDGNEK